MSDALNKYDALSFKNVSNADFDHKYEGDTYVVKAGETQIFPRFLAEHLAKHLARRICRSKFKGEHTKMEDGKQFGPGQLEEVRAKILVGIASQVSKPTMTAQERLRREVEELNKTTGANMKPNEPTKKEIMDQLASLGVKFDVSMKRDALAQLLDQYAPKNRPSGTHVEGDDIEVEKVKGSDAPPIEMRNGKLAATN